MDNSNSTISLDLDSVIKICEQFKKVIEPTKRREGYGNTPSELIYAAEKLKALGLEWGDRIQYRDFRIRKNYYITNSATGYKPNKEEFYIEWDNGNVGRLQYICKETRQKMNKKINVVRLEEMGKKYKELLEEVRDG